MPLIVHVIVRVALKIGFTSTKFVVNKLLFGVFKVLLEEEKQKSVALACFVYKHKAEPRVASAKVEKPDSKISRSM